MKNQAQFTLQDPRVPELPPNSNAFILGDGVKWIAKTLAQVVSLVLTNSTVTEYVTLTVGTVGNVTYAVVKMPYAATITNISSICRSGTCTATTKINTTQVTATANSVSSTNESQAVTGANSVAAGDYINVTVSSNSTCLDMTLTIKYTRTLA